MPPEPVILPVIFAVAEHVRPTSQFKPASKSARELKVAEPLIVTVSADVFPRVVLLSTTSRLLHVSDVVKVLEVPEKVAGALHTNEFAVPIDAHAPSAPGRCCVAAIDTGFKLVVEKLVADASNPVPDPPSTMFSFTELAVADEARAVFTSARLCSLFDASVEPF